MPAVRRHMAALDELQRLVPEIAAVFRARYKPAIHLVSVFGLDGNRAGNDVQIS